MRTVKSNKLALLGLIFMLFGMSIFIFHGIDQFVRPFTQPVLMGSSKGKDVLFFVLMGFTMMLATLFENRKLSSILDSANISDKFKDPQFYLKTALGLFLSLAVIGLLIEVYLRLSLGIDVFTIFVAMDPSPTTTSIYHSHLYKSIFGEILGALLIYIPAGIHTGSSLGTYTPSIVNILFIFIPIDYVLMILALQKRHPVLQFFLSFIFTIGIIGIIDGGFFATPTMGGILGMLIYIYNDEVLDIVLNYLLILKTKSFSNVKNDFSTVGNYFSSIARNDFIEGSENRRRYTKRLVKELIPYLAIIFIIILRITMSFYGSTPDSYELTIENAEDIDLSNYTILNSREDGNRTVVEISSEYNEMGLLNQLAETLKGKCDWYSLSMNAYSYFENGRMIFS